MMPEGGIWRTPVVRAPVFEFLIIPMRGDMKHFSTTVGEAQKKGVRPFEEGSELRGSGQDMDPFLVFNPNRIGASDDPPLPAVP